MRVIKNLENLMKTRRQILPVASTFPLLPAASQASSGHGAYLEDLNAISSPPQSIFPGRYSDSFSRQTDTRILVSRTVFPPIFGGMSGHLAIPPN